jgi:hypothetical protein
VVPVRARRMADAEGAASWRQHTVPHYIDLARARASHAVLGRGVLNAEDVALVNEIGRRSRACGENNVQNADRVGKHCTFLNKPPGAGACGGAGEATNADPIAAMSNPLRQLAPHVLGKLLRFGVRCWDEQQWSAPGGPLDVVQGGDGGHPLGSLKVRVAEWWNYAEGGHLEDVNHFDGGSILTIVTLLNDGFTGGRLSTNEPDGTQLDTGLAKTGSSCCFLSHKLHSVSRVLGGERRTLVIELWQGGTALHGR